MTEILAELTLGQIAAWSFVTVVGILSFIGILMTSDGGWPDGY